MNYRPVHIGGRAAFSAFAETSACNRRWQVRI